jgi:hypothetical protein
VGHTLRRGITGISKISCVFKVIAQCEWNEREPSDRVGFGFEHASKGCQKEKLIVHSVIKALW